MQDALVQGLTLVDASGYAIIATIVVILAAGIGLTFAVRGRYACLIEELNARLQGDPCESQVLRQIVAAAREARRRSPQEINTQVLIEKAFTRA